MPEELSPESKLYVKEELEKVRNEFKEGLKDAQSKTTKIFTTVALIVGLLASMGVYGLAKSSIKNAIEDKLGKTTIKNLETNANTLVIEIENIKAQAKELVTDANTYVKVAREDIDKLKSELLVEIENLEGRAKDHVIVANTYVEQAEGHLKDILRFKKIAHLPIGTILASMLAPDEFAVAVGNPDVFDANESGWVLADGQKDITNSRYGQLSGKTTTPDLRGVFLRGLNEGRNDGKQDPNDRRAAGDYQPDALQQHGHETNATEWGSGYALAGYAQEPKNAPKASVTDVTDARTADETRPKNVAVYFYIKIN